MSNEVFYSYVVNVASKAFGNKIFKRRPLMLAVVKQLKDEGLWLEKYDELSNSKGKKNKGLERIDYAFNALKNDGRFIHHAKNQWSIAATGRVFYRDFSEGEKIERTHLKIERKSEVIRMKKLAVMEKEGALKCEVCEFDFAGKYGEVGKGFSECHHLVPLASLEGKPGKTTEDDLIIICSNCHCMVHRALTQNQSLTTLGEIRSALLR